MNENETKFDPMTGQPINEEKNEKIESNNQEITDNEETKTDTKSLEDSLDTKEEIEKTNIQSVATVDQSSDQFIENVQADSKAKQKDNKEKSNYLFIIILFAIIFAAIFFLFPIISKYI